MIGNSVNVIGFWKKLLYLPINRLLLVLVTPYQLTLPILTGTVSPTSPEVWEVVGNIIYVKAENVLLENVVSPSEGYKLVIMASGSIDIDPDAVVNLNTELRSVSFYDNPKSPLVPINEEYYASNCNGDNYQANIPANFKRTINGTSSGFKGGGSFEEKTEISVYPNPVNQEVNVKVTSGELISCSIKVMSITGQTLILERVKSDLLNGFAIGVEHLTNGYYILELFSDDGYRVQKKFVVQH